MGAALYAAVVIICLGAATGVGFLLSLSVDGRTANVNAFNAASAAWPAAAPAFEGLTVFVVGSAPSALELPPSTDPDSYPDAAGLDLPSLSIHYTATSTATAPIAPRGYADGTIEALVVSVNGTLSYVHVPLFATSTGDHGKKSYKRLGSLCITVSPDRAVTSGCAIGDGYLKWQLVDCNFNDFVTFTIPIDVRSEADPYVKAMRVTGGSLRFGLSQAEKALIGGVLLGACVVLLGAACSRIGQAPDAPRPGGGIGGDGGIPAYAAYGGSTALQPPDAFGAVRRL